ncbi:hypothetical protein [uncultured Psychromonas sp.]|uniref:hypothetical protein n=1 Tax=uncultured Psychromonas sp. TaxID=173974 RepID=UPI00260656DA|nr:hypothetical protein [uncultured Psychromonas sp.]
MQDFIQYIIFGGGLFAALSLYYFTFHQSPNVENWQDLPYLEDYLKIHPDCEIKGKKNVKCCYCHSDKVQYKAAKSNKEHHYQHFCSACKKNLFRSRTLNPRFA